MVPGERDRRVMSDGNRNRNVPLVDRFWMKVVKGDDCWEWIGARNPSGHGRFWVAGKNAPAHVFSYELHVGPVPEGLHLDHLCRHPWCVNPEHLEPVSLWENLRRAPATPAVINAGKTECPQGHPYDEANTCFSNGRRHCRTCQRERAQAKRDRMKGHVQWS